MAELQMTSDENRTFFKTFGVRLARLRKESGVTQVQLAEILGYSQQQIASFESGRRRIPLSAIPVVMKAIGVTFEELMGIKKSPNKPRKRGPPSKLEQQLEKLAKLPANKRRLVSEMLDGILAQAS
jgi:transcriptional regulator with XRE-family HTH domain